MMIFLSRCPNVKSTQFSFTSSDNFYYNDTNLMTAVNMAYDLTTRQQLHRSDFPRFYSQESGYIIINDTFY